MPPAGLKQKDLDLGDAGTNRNTDQGPETENINYRFHVEHLKTNDKTMTNKTQINLESIKKRRIFDRSITLKTNNMHILIDATIKHEDKKEVLEILWVSIAKTTYLAKKHNDDTAELTTMEIETTYGPITIQFIP